MAANDFHIIFASPYCSIVHGLAERKFNQTKFLSVFKVA